MPLVGIILGSDSDLPKIKGCFDTLEKFGVDFEIIISSAHRTPEETVRWTKTAASRGLKVIIAAAGGAAHLPGVVSAHTMLPVIGVPIATDIAGGLDSILSILQMPSGIPVAAMPAGGAGGTNAALFAVRILSLGDSNLQKNLEDYITDMAVVVKKKNDNLKEFGYKNYIKELEKSK